MLNLGVVLRDGEESDAPDRILAQCRAQGWKLLHRLIWSKPNGQVPSAPGYLTVAHEFVLWLAPTVSPWRAYEQEPGCDASRLVRTPHARSSVSHYTRQRTGAGCTHPLTRKHDLHPDGARPTTVISVAVGGEPNPNGHPARMPIKLAQHLVALCCPPGALAFDPFSGDATTGIAATRLGRRYLGVEINPEYAEQSRQRLAGDAPLLQDDVASHEQLALGA